MGIKLGRFTAIAGFVLIVFCLSSTDKLAWAADPAMTSPLPGSTLTKTAVTFTWSSGTGVDTYWLMIGTGTSKSTRGDKYDQSVGTNTSATVSGVPLNGNTLYVRLWWRKRNTWYKKDYTYQTQSGKGCKQEITSPIPGTQICNTTEQFCWNECSGTVYWLGVGTSQASLANSPYGDIFAGSVTGGCQIVNNIPSNGTLYVRLWYKESNGSWQFNDYTYKPDCGNSTPWLYSPAENSRLTCGDVSFNWTSNGIPVSQWWLHVGTKRGGKDILNRDIGELTSYTVSGIPEDGSTVYVRLWYKSEGTWKSAYFQYTACGGGGCAGFEEHWSYNDKAPDWIRDSGSWEVDIAGTGPHDWWYEYFSSGVSNKSATSTYNATYSNFDFSALVYRYSTNNEPNRLIVRASGAIRSNGKPTNFYSFQYKNSGEYSVYKTVGGVATALKGWTSSSGIVNSGWIPDWESGQNLLRVVARGPNLTYYINGTMVWNGSDNSLSSGRVGFSFFRKTDTLKDYFAVIDADLDCFQ
ncbi:MAG: hypothetical protein MRK01_16865 [Candidatus Scalindua sp.]|nr:hypothetical protein [Candidatus Scalindua sp.]